MNKKKKNADKTEKIKISESIIEDIIDKSSDGHHSDCILHLENLTKSFKDLIAVNKIDLEISRGEIFGLLGPNGAGKTTIIKMLCTILNPTSGEATICGHDIINDRDGVRKSIGVVFQDPSSDEELTGYENMFFHGKIYGLETETIKQRTEELLTLVELHDKKDILVKEYSGGMKRRLEIARGLMHNPKVLFLDEPTVGLDPQTRTKIWEYIEKLNKKEKITIILTTHYMEEADKLCSRVGIIDRGKVIAIGSPEKLKETVKGDTITIGIDDPEKLRDVLLPEKTITKMTVFENHEKGLIINTRDAEKKIPMIFKLAEKHRLEIKSITLHKPTLEDIFLHFTGRKIREEYGENFASKVRMMNRLR